MDCTVTERFARIRKLACTVEMEAREGRWNSAMTRAFALESDAAFILDWLRGQAEYRSGPAGGEDNWAPTAEAPLGNISEPLAGTLDADLPEVPELRA